MYILHEYMVTYCDNKGRLLYLANDVYNIFYNKTIRILRVYYWRVKIHKFVYIFLHFTLFIKKSAWYTKMYPRTFS